MVKVLSLKVRDNTASSGRKAPVAIAKLQPGNGLPGVMDSRFPDSLCSYPQDAQFGDNETLDSVDLSRLMQLLQRGVPFLGLFGTVGIMGNKSRATMPNRRVASKHEFGLTVAAARSLLNLSWLGHPTGRP